MLWKEQRSISKKKKTPEMESTNVAEKKSEDSLTLLQTGLFVSWDRSNLLLHIIQDMLRSRFLTSPERGPRRDNDTCEIILRALQPTGANFAASKVVLEQYLTLIQESKPDFFIERQPEVIDLVGEDDDVSLIILDKKMDGTIPVIDLDSSSIVEKNHTEKEGYCAGQNSSSTDRYVKSDSNNILVIDLLKETKSPGTPQFETGAKSILKESNNQSRKRKFPFEEEDVVEILDDDSIIHGDSFSTSNSIFSNHNHTNTRNLMNQCLSNLKVTTVGDSRNVSESTFKSRNGIKITPKTKKDKILTGSSSTMVSFNYSKNANELLPNSSNANTIESQNNNTKAAASNNSKSTFSNPPKNLSKKLTYKRPAHLVKPLINKTSTGNEKTDSSASNIYNPDAGVSDKRTGLRPIVIDGNNVAVSHGKGQFSLKGIQICVNYFEKRGHRQIKAFIPHYRINKGSYDALHKMERQGTVVITPSRKVEGKIVASYDDRYIVQYASEFGGVIVSTDNYRDLMEENPSWKETIEKRLLMFTWVDDLLMFPQDPLGRRGPSLENFLKFPD